MKQLAVFFGGVSVEHEVSIITGLQLIKHVDRSRYDVQAIYVDKTGAWWTGEAAESLEYYKTQDLFAPSDLQARSFDLSTSGIDVAILCFHGAYGEAGNVQAALELADIPYQGPAVTSSALCFDKIFTRLVLSGAHMPQTEYVWCTAAQWKANRDQIIENVAALHYPVYVKPANGGSTIGIERVLTAEDLPTAVDRVLQYDSRVLFEREVVDCIEVNVSVLGYDGQTQASIPEQPVKSDAFLTFADKYEKGGKKSGMASATRRIPAPISSSLTKKLQALAQDVFQLLDCSGVVRIDFFVNPSTQEIFITEINTIPGSMSFYLWEASGISYPQLIDQLVEIALHTATQRGEKTTSFETNILQTGKI